MYIVVGIEHGNIYNYFSPTQRFLRVYIRLTDTILVPRTLVRVNLKLV